MALKYQKLIDDLHEYAFQEFYVKVGFPNTPEIKQYFLKDITSGEMAPEVINRKIEEGIKEHGFSEKEVLRIMKAEWDMQMGKPDPPTQLPGFGLN